MLWRSTATRLLLLYGALFVVWSAILIGVISWSTTRYLSHIVDQILEQRLHYLTTLAPERLPEAMAITGALDLRDVMSYGLFARDGSSQSGNILRVPERLEIDGQVHPLPEGVQRRGRSRPLPARAIATRLEDGRLLVLARDTSVVDQVGTIIRYALLWGLSLTVIPGVIGGFLLSRGPLRRMRAIEAAVQPIVRGDLGRRLPVSPRRDEIDLLAGIVNTMLAELERLMGEVKGVCDAIAHDLRTPLTRLRAQLHRLRQETAEAPGAAAMVESCLADVEALLDRFRALLRISELEDRRRRAGFGVVDLAATLRQVHDLYAPLAEDKGIALEIDLAAAPPEIQADRDLLFEACSNLVSNAIKFTPSGGTVMLRVGLEAGGPRLEVIDSGPGIPPDEREAVLQRFYRSESGRQVPGFGLGLSIVAAIARLHGFRLEIAEGASGGTRVSLHCVADPLA